MGSALKKKVRSWLGIEEDLKRTQDEYMENGEVIQSLSDDVGILIEDIQKLKDYTGITDNEEFMSYGGKETDDGSQ
jgi:hypothetical protein